MDDSTYDEMAASSQDRVLEYEILDLDINAEQQRQQQDSCVAGPSVSSVASETGITFYVDEDEDDEGEGEDGEGEDGEGEDGEDSERIRQEDDDPVEIVTKTLKQRKLFRNDDEQEDSDQAANRKKKELTAQYMAGEVSFQDLLRGIKPASDSESEDDLDSDSGDAEWIPTMKKSKLPKSSQRTKNTSGAISDVLANEEDHQASFESELAQTSREHLGKRRKGAGPVKTRRRKLDPALQGLMGEANLNFARGDRDTAVRMCMEIIRQNPTVPEPFQTLSTIYEEEDPEKSLQMTKTSIWNRSMNQALALLHSSLLDTIVFFQEAFTRIISFALLAAHLAPQDAEEWARLANMSLEMQNLQQAADCYRKAIDADIENVRYHQARCILFERMGEKKAALRGYKRLLGVLKDNQGQEYISAAKEIARLYHERGDIEEAKTAIESAMRKHPKSIEEQDVNLLLELYLALGLNDEALEIFLHHCSVKFSSELDQATVSKLDPEQQLKAFTTVHIREDMPLDLKAKLITVLVNLKAVHLVQDISAEVVALDAEEFGDLMLDIAEAMMENGYHKESIQFLEKLVQSQEYSQPVVWLKYGESLFEDGRLNDAEVAYSHVVEMAPQHHDARETLSTILHKLGRPDEALDTLAQDEEELLNPTLLYERCQLLLAEGCTEDFIVKSKLLFSRHFVHIRNREEVHAIAGSKKMTSKNRALSEVRTYRKEPLNEVSGPSFDTDLEIPLQDEYELFRKLCDVLFQNRRYSELQRVTFSALGSPYFNKKQDIARECELLCLLASFFNGDSYHAYNLVRDLAFKHVKEPRIWNLFNLVIMRADDIRHNRFLMRLMTRNPENIALGILNGHNCLVAGTYKYSLGEYMSAFKQDPKNPMIALMLGLTFTHLACQKFSAKKHSLVIQSCAFLNTYLQLRGRCQEAYYNLGRAMHQLGLLPAALHYYKLALELSPALAQESGADKDSFNPFDLQREIAYNLSLIYQNSGSYDLARMYLQQHIII